MKSIGATSFVAALALVAGCSSGSPEATPRDETVKSSASLIAPSPGDPEDDPCASVRCAAGTECVVVDERATCAETDINPCAAVSCLVGTTCEVIDGEAACTPIAPSACAAVLCPTGTTCDVVDDEPVCTPITPSACAAVLCPTGTTCDVVDDEPVCSPIPPSGPFCGGFAGISCPGSGICVDDATDDCDPNNGGFDCGGVCECNSLALCIEGFSFDDSVDVCACVPVPETNPCALVDCFPNLICQVIEGEPVCVEPGPNPCALVLCAPETFCVVEGDEARCVPADHDCN
jgi:hypothetical protein